MEGVTDANAQIYLIFWSELNFFFPNSWHHETYFVFFSYLCDPSALFFALQ